MYSSSTLVFGYPYSEASNRMIRYPDTLYPHSFDIRTCFDVQTLEIRILDVHYEANFNVKTPIFYVKLKKSKNSLKIM